MPSKPDQFDRQSPQKVYGNANNFSTNYPRKNQMPQSPIKKDQLHDLRQYNKDEIRYTIDRCNYQNNLYRRLEKEDEVKRKSFDIKIKEKDKTVVKNQQELKKKEDKEVEKINKQLDKVYKKHVEIERNKKYKKDDEAIKLRKELLRFYSKEKERKQEADRLQLKVDTCHQYAVNLLDKIHYQNVQYARQAQLQNQSRMTRNNNRDQYLMEQVRAQSAENAKKRDIYDNNSEIMKNQEHRYVQIYCDDLDHSNMAFKFKDTQNNKEKERIEKFFKKRTEKWKEHKYRVDEDKKRIPQKTIQRMARTQRASFQPTQSKFKQSGRQWYKRVQMNKSAIYERDELDKDRIMRTHLDMRLRNSATSDINNRMGTMRTQAKKLANEFY